MAKQTEKLTAVTVKTAATGERAYRLSDGNGLYLEVMPNGSKYWRMAYRFNGRQKTLALGVFPEVSLANARRACIGAREQLANGADPSETRQLQKRIGAEMAANSFAAVASEWLTKQTAWTPSNQEKVESMLQRDLLPWLGPKPIAKITPPEILSSLRRIEARGALESAHRARSLCGQIFRYAVATGRAERDQAADLRGALPPVKTTHHAAITDPKKVADLLRAIDNYGGNLVVRCAFRLTPLVLSVRNDG